ncbi:MAG TPA: helix-turn-helix domain-containing protein [Acidimicrobiales bacterium]|nr:helix-turn-helix domain-containing protein [Acidimicrobiales bacterium]
MTSSEPAPRRRRKAADDAPQSLGRHEDDLLTTAQVAQMLHVSTRSVLKFIQDGILPAHRLPGTRQFLFWRRDVIAVINASAVNPADVSTSDADDRSVTGAE